MTQHNSDDEHHPLEPFWQLTPETVAAIMELPEFETLFKNYHLGISDNHLRYDPMSPLGHRVMILRQQINDFMSLSEEPVHEDNQDSKKLRNFLEHLKHSDPDIANTIELDSVVQANSVMEAALKRSLELLNQQHQKVMENIKRIRKQLGDQE